MIRAASMLDNAQWLDHRELFERVPQCVLVVDINGQVLIANQAVELVFGYPPDEVVGRALSLLIPGASAPDGLAGLVGSEVEIEGLHRLGHPIAIELTAEEWIAEARELLIVVIRENGERRRLIDALTRAREQAERASLAKSSFLAAMSHELRTPMNGVLGMLEVLSHISDDPMQAELVGTIGESATSLLGLLDDILDFSRIEAEQLNLEREPVRLRALAEGVCNVLVESARAGGVELRLFVDPDSPEQIVGDELRLRQVLLNLTSNAVKFSSGQSDRIGRVAIRLRVERQAELVMLVADNGIGITAEASKALFEPFTQAEASTTRRFGGTGLGLAICKRLVGLMGGTIGLASTPAVGSAFTVRVPVSIVPGPSRAAAPLAGIACVVMPGRWIDTADIVRYLVHAGADLFDSISAIDSTQAPLVVIQDIEPEQDWAAITTSIAQQQPGAAQLLLARGRRRHARRLAASVLMLDVEVLRRDSLIEAVLSASGAPAGVPAGVPDRQPQLRVHAAEGALPILVAEDDRVNRRVIACQLELLGFAADIAVDGADALDRWRTGHYSVVLTDMHMPLMDGYQLTRAIRAEEREGQRIPIIALTANALKGEAAGARAAGVDAWLTKPVRLRELGIALSSWMPSTVGAHPTPPTIAAAASSSPDAAAARPCIDIDVLRELVGDDPAMLAELIEDFCRSARQTHQEMKRVHAAGEATALAALAHRLKSSSRAVGALALADACVALERGGGAGNHLAIEAGMRLLDDAMTAVVGAIEALPAPP
jgi:signal transduction histidine kinase/DNA-binding response OmpR family regulator